MHTKVVLVWAWDSYDEQHIDALCFDSEEMALKVAVALSQVKDVRLGSKVRVFRTPSLDELELPKTSSGSGPAQVSVLRPQ